MWLTFDSRLGEGCSHVAAVMFKVEYAVRQGFTSVTSSICGWNSSFDGSDDGSSVKVTMSITSNYVAIRSVILSYRR